MAAFQFRIKWLIDIVNGIHTAIALEQKTMELVALRFPNRFQRFPPMICDVNEFRRMTYVVSSFLEYFPTLSLYGFVECKHRYIHNNSRQSTRDYLCILHSELCIWLLTMHAQCSLFKFPTTWNIYLRVFFELWVNDVRFISLQFCSNCYWANKAMTVECVRHASVPIVMCNHCVHGIGWLAYERHWRVMLKSCVLSVAYCTNIIHYFARSTWNDIHFKRIWWMSPNYAYHFVLRLPMKLYGIFGETPHYIAHCSLVDT